MLAKRSKETMVDFDEYISILDYHDSPPATAPTPNKRKEKKKKKEIHTISCICCFNSSKWGLINCITIEKIKINTVRY